ncbi:hypothetical protein PM030_12345 [Halorubrum ezzemoulense]|uniref:hypothetical protein n=1 Tax=Halorubrum ezzemoulense TaxID=337243 RepID=UPI00232B6409|nr:hypothetical protein [Halorubrum ezzemoulense]MDB2282662.1 hypothetical protein [Halorubrum ezzemoulense]
MKQTPNHNYNTPDEGEENWHIPLNENFDQIDSDIEIRGKEENKSDYEPEVGTKYEATDSGAVYYGNGDEWVLTDRSVDSILANQIQNDGPRIVSPSINAGYDSLQSAIDDAKEAGSTTIWVAEDIHENIVIPEDESDWHHKGLIIKGVSKGRTKIIDDVQDGETPVIKSNERIVRLTLENLDLEYKGPPENGAAAISLRGSVPFLTMIGCRTNAPSIITKPFFSYFERCYFSSRSFIEVDAGPGDESVMTDAALILSGGNLARIDRCTFMSHTAWDNVRDGTNWALLWLLQINNVELTQPEFKVRRARYDENTDHAVASCLVDGACGDIHMDSPYCEGLMDTHYRFARTPLTQTGSPRAVFMTNVRGQHYTIDQYVAGLYIKTDGAENKKLVQNHGVSHDSYFKTPENTPVNYERDDWVGKEIKIIEGESPEKNVETPDLPDSTGESSSVTNNQNIDCLVYHDGKGAEISHSNVGTLYGSPAYVPHQQKIWFSDEVPANWTWIGLPIR